MNRALFRANAMDGLCRASAFILACLFFQAGCAGQGGLILVSNPSLARMLSLSPDEASKLPPEKRFSWALERFGMDAADFEYALSRNDGNAATGAAGRLLEFLGVMHSTSSPDQARDILDIARAYVALAESACTGRAGRGAVDAARGLRLEAASMEPAPGRADAGTAVKKTGAENKDEDLAGLTKGER